MSDQPLITEHPVPITPEYLASLFASPELDVIHEQAMAHVEANPNWHDDMIEGYVNARHEAITNNPLQ